LNVFGQRVCAEVVVASSDWGFVTDYTSKDLGVQRSMNGGLYPLVRFVVEGYFDLEVGDYEAVVGSPCESGSVK
jgi:hypothetical protein